MQTHSPRANTENVLLLCFPYAHLLLFLPCAGNKHAGKIHWNSNTQESCFIPCSPFSVFVGNNPEYFRDGVRCKSSIPLLLAGEAAVKDLLEKWKGAPDKCHRTPTKGGQFCHLSLFLHVSFWRDTSWLWWFDCSQQIARWAWFVLSPPPLLSLNTLPQGLVVCALSVGKKWIT